MPDVHPTTFWAIGDLHLSFGKPRDLSKFGEVWQNHTERLAADWRAKVKAEDVVLLLGDISWATTYRRVKPDLEWVAELPGQKIIIRGNHDRWWSNIQTVRRSMLPKGMQALQGDTLEIEGLLLCGAQGHIAPNDPYYRPDPPHNRYERELATLTAGLAEVRRVRKPNQPLIILMHYPPFTSEGHPTAYSALIEAHAPAYCLYGHLHKPHEWAVAIQGEHNGITYRLMASDYMGMQLQKVWPLEGE